MSFLPFGCGGLFTRQPLLGQAFRVAALLALICTLTACGKPGSAADGAAAKKAPAFEIVAKPRVPKIAPSSGGPLVTDLRDGDFIIVDYSLTSRSGASIKEWGCYFRNWSTDNEAVRMRTYPCNQDRLSEVPIRKGKTFNDSVQVRVVGAYAESTVEFRICYSPVDAAAQPKVPQEVLGRFCSNLVKLEVVQSGG
jgi:predicted small lipoprotein YifL